MHSPRVPWSQVPAFLGVWGGGAACTQHLTAASAQVSSGPIGLHSWSYAAIAETRGAQTHMVVIETRSGHGDTRCSQTHSVVTEPHGGDGLMGAHGDTW